MTLNAEVTHVTGRLSSCLAAVAKQPAAQSKDPYHAGALWPSRAAQAIDTMVEASRVRRLRAALLLCWMFSMTAQAQYAYKVIPLPREAGGPFHGQAKDISNKGWIAGTRKKPDAPTRGFRWKPGNKLVALPGLGGTCSLANGINDWNHEVGSACLAGDALQHAAMWRKGQVIDLDTFGSVGSEATRLNNTDHVVGDYTLGDGTTHGFFLKGATSTEIPSLGGSATFPEDVNDSGVVTGFSDASNIPDPVFGIPPFHGFQWVDGVITDFGPIFGSKFNFGNAVDAKGRIVGAADLAGDQAADAIVWNQGLVHRLPHVPTEEPVNWALATNNLGEIVGAVGFVDDPIDGPPTSSMACPCTGVVWQHGRASYLDVPPDWTIYLAKAINDAGEILAVAKNNGGGFQDVILKPNNVAASALRRPVEPNISSKHYFGPRRLRRDFHGRILVEE